MADPRDPTAPWPRHLQESWGDCTARGEVDAQNPPASMVDAYLQVAVARVRRLASIPWGDGTQHDLADDEEELLSANLRRTLAVCAKCGAADLEYFYTSKRDGQTVRAGCYRQRVERGTGPRRLAPFCCSARTSFVLPCRGW